MSSTHACLNVDEILRHLACELVASGGKGAAVALACCCKNFEDPVLDALWETQDQLRPLLKSFPADVWNDEDSVSASPTFDLLSTKIFDLIVFQKNSHSSGMGPLPDIRSMWIPLKTPYPRTFSRCYNIAPSTHPCFQV